MSDANCPPIPGYEPLRFVGWVCAPQGTIHLARQTDRNLVVALQVFPHRPPDGPAATRVAKARQVLGWRHPNILGVIDVGEAEDCSYIALEHIEGLENLSVRLKRGPLPASQAISTARQIASVLGNARDKGMVWHSSSIWFTAHDEVRLSALGFDAENAWTLVWQLVGSAFLAPEWLTSPSSTASPASDVYRLGVAIYAMLTGRLPFGEDSHALVLRRILEGSPTPVRKISPNVPESVEALCMKCLARHPPERYATVRHVAQSLSSLLADVRS